MKVAIYIRVSTEDQAKEGYSLEVQREYLEDFAMEKGDSALLNLFLFFVRFSSQKRWKFCIQEKKGAVPFFPTQKGVDCTWEREWRICCDELLLEPEHTLVVAPDAKTAFDIAYSYSEEDISTQGETIAEEGVSEEGGQVKILTRKPKWMTVSLDLFDIKPAE